MLCRYGKSSYLCIAIKKQGMLIQPENPCYEYCTEERCGRSYDVPRRREEWNKLQPDYLISYFILTRDYKRV